MKFNTIAKFLKFKERCPFCKQNLSPEIGSYWAHSIEHQIKNVCFREDIWTFNQTTQYSYNTSMGQGSLFKYKFDIGLSLNSHAIEYQEISLPNYISPAEFNKGFNASKVYISIACHNKECEYEYAISTMPLLAIDQKLEEIMLYSETFVLPKYRCSNVYGDKLYIYKRHEKFEDEDEAYKSTITAEFHELNEQNSKNIQKRISTIVTFS